MVLKKSMGSESIFLESMGSESISLAELGFGCVKSREIDSDPIDLSGPACSKIDRSLRASSQDDA